ncbi:MAG: T9SS type A sorting domain-containing protein [Flavobacteriales bacterium]|nr:T9SS type A sorting domain-containing protein [Flavobacteriales bacterium]
MRETLLETSILFHSNCYIDGDTVLGSADAFIAKFDSNGSLIWLKNCISPTGSIAIADLVIDTLSQSIYAIGTYVGGCVLDTITTYAGNYAGVMLSSWSYSGSCLWVKNVATSSTDLNGAKCVGRSVALMSNGQIVVSGTTTQYAQTFVQGALYAYGSFIAGYNSDGSPLWARQFIEQNSGLSSLSVNLDNHGARLYACVPYGVNSQADTVSLDTLMLVGGSTPEQGYLLSRIDPVNGDILWVSREGIGANIALVNEPIAINVNGQLAMVGIFSDTAIFSIDTLLSANNSGWSSFIAIHDSSGALLSAKAYQSSGGVRFENIASDPLGGFYATGIVQTGSGNWDGVPISVSNQAVFISKHTATSSCQGIFTDGTGAFNTSSLLPTTNGLYLGLGFPGQNPTGSVTLGDSSFTTYGYKDAILAKLGLITSVSSYSTEGQDDLLIYANPNNGLCTVELPLNLRFTPNLNLVIFDAQGRQVQRIPVTTGSDGVRLDITSQAKGMYHVELSDGVQRYSGRIVFGVTRGRLR